MTHEFERFSEQDDEWLSELEIRAIDLEQEIADWRESRTHDFAEAGYLREEALGQTTQAFRAFEPDDELSPQAAPTQPVRTTLRATGGRKLAGAQHRGAANGHPRADDRRAIERRAGDHRARDHKATERRASDHRAAEREVEEGDAAADRTQVLIDRGRTSAARRHMSRGLKITLVTAVLVVGVTILVLILSGSSAAWPASVATVKNEIAVACQNPNVVSEPDQVNFSCAKDTSQILWVFALVTSDDNPYFSNAKTGRKGLEPITATQGGEVAWSLDLHSPYNPLNPVDSLEVAARAINNIVGGATLTNAEGKPTVQSGLESSAENCDAYSGSSAIVSRAGFPNVCAEPVSSPAGQAALVANIYQEWVVGATSAQAQQVAVLFENADNPGNPQVQAILKSLPAVG